MGNTKFHSVVLSSKSEIIPSIERSQSPFACDAHSPALNVSPEITCSLSPHMTSTQIKLLSLDCIWCPRWSIISLDCEHILKVFTVDCLWAEYNPSSFKFLIYNTHSFFSEWMLVRMSSFHVPDILSGCVMELYKKINVYLWFIE